MQDYSQLERFGVHYCHPTPTNIVVSDLKLPDISGLDILLALKKFNPDAAFILMTGHASLETAIEAVNRGAFAYHVKPLDMEALNNSVRNALKQQQLLAENRDLLDRLQLSNKELTKSNTKLRTTTEQLQQSELKYRTVVEQSADGIFIAEVHNGRFIEANPSMEALTGYCREELLQLSLPLLHAEAEQVSATNSVGRMLEDDPAASNYLSLRKKDGRQVSVDLNTNVVEYQGRRVALGIIRDITERRREEERLRETARLVSIGELAAGVAHEINNPLTVVIGFSEILLAKDLPEPEGSRVQRIYSEAQRAAKIVQNLLSFARRREPEKRYVDVAAILERALELKAYDFKVSNIQVVSEWATDLPHTMVDEHQLVQAILNIMTNAEQAMMKSNDEGEMGIRVGRSGDRIRISISDDGPGIPQEHLYRIFDPFFTTKEVGTGTGLGLSICYGIIRQHGGEIWAESVPGKGATFHIEIPVSGPVGEMPHEEPQSAHSPGSVKQILVVDDEPNIRNLLVEALSTEHYTVDQTADGQEAWHKLQRKSYDCVLMDLKMPGMSGQQLYKLITESHLELARKVVFITGDTVSPETSAFIEATGNPALNKPFSIEELRKQILEFNGSADRPAAPESLLAQG